MAVAFNIATDSAVFSGGNPTPWTVTPSGGPLTNPCAILFVCGIILTSATVTATYDGVAMTACGSVKGSISGTYSACVFVFQLTGIPTSSGKTVAVSISNGTSDLGFCSCAIFSGVDQTTPVGTAVTDFRDDPTAVSIDTLTMAVPSNGALIAGICLNAGHGGSSTGNLTSRLAQESSGYGFYTQTTTATANPQQDWPTGAAFAQLGLPINASSSSITVAIGLASETDSALAMTANKAKAVGQPSETDAGQSMAFNGTTVYLDLAHSRELRNELGAIWGAVSGWKYAWYDSLTAPLGAGPVSAAGQGTFDTNSSSEARVAVPGTTLTLGQSGVMLIQHPSYPATPVYELRVMPIGP